MAVAFDAVGGGKAADSSSSLPNNFTWSHTASGSDLAVLVFVAVATNASPLVNVVRSATYGGVAMTELSSASLSNSYHLLVFGLLNPATGAQTVAVNLSGVTSGSSGNSVSYTGVDSFGAVSTAGATGSPSGTSMSHGVTGSAVGRRIVQTFVANQATGNSITAYNQSSRFSVAKGTWSPAIVVGDAAGAAGTVTFTGTRASAVPWQSRAIDLIEAVAPAGNTGAFFAMF